MNILLTSSRAPVTLDLIRMFGRAGHTVHASDTQPWTLGSHSRYLQQHHVTPPPRHDPAGFGAALTRITRQHQIDLVVPICEEVVYLSAQLPQLAEHTRVFTAPLDQIEMLHNKATFGCYAAERGLRTPRSVRLQTPADLRHHLPQFPRYLIKPVYSRFATQIITNCGPRAGTIPLAACQPTPAQPWLLQEFVDGAAICSYSVVQRGHVTTHCAYRTPYTADHGAGVQCVTVDGVETLELVQRLVAHTGYTGQLALDFLATSDGLCVLECNPRATSGAHLIDPAKLIGGMRDPAQPTWISPAGRCRQLALPLLASVAKEPHRWPAAIRAVVQCGDVIIALDDPLPALIQLRMLLHFLRISRRDRISLTAATTNDIEWNGVSA